MILIGHAAAIFFSSHWFALMEIAMDASLLLENVYAWPNLDENTSISMKNGRISGVSRIFRGSASRVIDLEGRVVIPGFIDSHTHLLRLGLTKSRLDLDGAASREEALEKTQAYAQRTRSSLVIGYNWDESAWPDRDYLVREDLDFTEKPVVLYRKDGHMATLNDPALRAIGHSEIRDGILREEDLGLLEELVRPGHDEIQAAIRSAESLALQLGVTTVRDMVDSATLAAYRETMMTLRILPAIYLDQWSPAMHSLMGHRAVKCFLDGSIGSGTAAHESWSGENLKFPAEKFRGVADRVNGAGLPLAAHAIGEIANRVASGVLSGRKGALRNSIEHFELVDEEIIGSLDANLVASSQPNFLQWSHPGGLYDNRLGKEWLSRNNPFRLILDSGKHLAFGSDCMPFSPEFGISEAVSSDFLMQRISLDEAIGCYTEGSAYLLGMEKHLGRIAEGFIADLAIFPSDFSIRSRGKGIAGLRPDLTVSSGNIAYSGITLR